MSAAPSNGRRAGALRGALAIGGAWTLYGLVHAGFWLTTVPPDSGPGATRLAEWSWVVPSSFILAWAWAILTPVIFAITRRFAPKRVGWFWSLLVHGVAFVLVASAMIGLRSALITNLGGRNTQQFLQLALFWMDVNLFTYLTVVLTGWAIQSHRRYIDRAVRAHVLETQLARAQLQYLELQLQPHFLFNSLNTIQELAHEAPAAAERVLRRLHALLSMSLERSGRDEVSLNDELSALGAYLDIQQTRFEWLTVTVRSDDEAGAGLVPHLILQPLVENAIRHGLAVRRGPGHIDVTAAREGDRLLLNVRDNGVGLPTADQNRRPGIGLRNAVERLRQLYGTNHRFEMRDAQGGGVEVEIDIPFRAAPRVAQKPSWTELGRSRETIPEVTVDEVAAWQTGEFVAPLPPPNDSALRRPSPVSPAPAVEDRLSVLAPSAPLVTTEEHAVDRRSPLFTVSTVTALVALWLFAAAFWTAQMSAYSNLLVGEADVWALARINVAGAIYWMAVSMVVLYLARRFRLYRGRLLPHLAIHVAAAVTASLVFLFAIDIPWLHTARLPFRHPLHLNPLTGNFFVYFGLLAWSHSRDFVAWYRQQELTAAQLTSEIARSRFQALCVQVRPQFLLGTLDLLARLVHVDVPRAERLIARLADVLRLTLEMAREPVTTLEQELQLLAVTVEAHRLGVRPSVSLDESIDPAALDTIMPSRLLCTMVDDLLAAEPEGAATPLVVGVRAERARDATRIRLHGEAAWKSGGDLHAWWRKKSAAEAAVAEAGPLVTVAFPDRMTAVLIIADERPVTAADAVAA